MAIWICRVTYDMDFWVKKIHGTLVFVLKPIDFLGKWMFLLPFVWPVVRLGLSKCSPSHSDESYMSPADTYHWGYWGDDLYAVQFFRPQTLLVLAYLDSRMLEHAQAPFQKRKKQKRIIIVVVIIIIIIIIIIIRRILEQYPLPTQAQFAQFSMVHLLEPPESCRFTMTHGIPWYPMVSHGAGHGKISTNYIWMIPWYTGIQI